jgi:hypothetical protein
MDKKTANPFLRGMGAKEDFIAEQFVPGAEYKARQMEMARELIASGIDPAEVAEMFAVPIALLSPEKHEEL